MRIRDVTIAPPRGRFWRAPPVEGDPLTRRLALAAVAATALLAASIVADVPEVLRGPAPYPPEWQWLRRGGVTSGAFLTALVSIALLALLILGTARAPRCGGPPAPRGPRWPGPRFSG